MLTENEKGVCVKNTRPICSDMELAHHNRSRTKHEERRKERFRSLHENLPDGSSMVSIVGVCYGQALVGKLMRRQALHWTAS